MYADKRELAVGRSRSVEVVVLQAVHQAKRNHIDAPNAQGTTDNTTSRVSLFQAGRELAMEAVCEAGWRNTNQFKIHTLKPNSAACFIWSKEPPHLCKEERSTQECIQLRAWGEPVQEDEIIRLDDLDEFQHVHLSNTPAQSTIGVKRHAEEDSIAIVLQPRKKRKLFSGSLHGIIKQPYFYSSISNTTMRGQLAPIPPYAKSKPIAIPPYVEGLMQPSRPLVAFIRTAWIIPIRGVLPWNGCTPAVVLEGGDEGVGKQDNWIQWTGGALNSFWTFLLNIRKAGKLGQVGVSLHVATARERDSSLSADTINDLYSSSIHGMDEFQVSSLPLSAADYIKVYHEVINAMALRNILDAWAYVCPGGRKVRVLKGSKLILVDERSKGMLVS